MRACSSLLVGLASLLVVGCGGNSGNNAQVDAGPTRAACDDGIDNDGDGKTDYPYDPGCVLAQADSEADDCPSGPGCPQCANGIDDNGDGMTDFPEDPGCMSAADNAEFLENPIACGVGLVIKGLPFSGMATGTFDGQSTSMITTSCGGGGGASGYAYLIHLARPRVLVATTDMPGTTADTVLDLRSANCSEPSAHIACNDDIGMRSPSSLTVSLDAGSYYLIVQGKTVSAVGPYELHVQTFAGEGTACATVDECGPGLVCRTPAGGSQQVCTGTVCNDGVDDDGDGKTDFPADPGCSAIDDDTEDDACPSGPGCPACGDGVDNDGDGATDYPADSSCFAASGTTESCTQTEPLATITQQVTSGTTVGAVNDYTPSCGTTSTTTPHTAGDVALQLDVPPMATLNLTLSSSHSAVHALLDASCAAAVACSNPTNMQLQSIPAGRYYVVVDGFSNATGTFSLTTTGTVAPGGSCEGPLFAAGAFTCAAGLACTGPAGQRTCFSECADGVDNNGNGKTDYPNDPGCTSPADTTEQSVCPGAGCPACSNTTDDDADGQIDYPADFGCGSAGDPNEAFCPIETTPGTLITTPQVTGSFVGTADNYEQSCDTTTGNDVAFALQLPVPVAKLVLDDIGSATDTTFSVWDAGCGVELGCEDLNELMLTNVPAGNYAIQVDGGLSTTTTGNFLVNVKGTVAAGTVCTSPLFATGVLVCPTGTTCNGTCQ
ncbi:MAG: hypothetical protein M3680_08595 [Myxococcota bacterium]|nr:hypothetical protein [Myxococcota bacterium]